jgi:hypothetical protein
MIPMTIMELPPYAFSANLIKPQNPKNTTASKMTIVKSLTIAPIPLCGNERLLVARHREMVIRIAVKRG